MYYQYYHNYDKRQNWNITQRLLANAGENCYRKNNLFLNDPSLRRLLETFITFHTSFRLNHWQQTISYPTVIPSTSILSVKWGKIG